MIANVKCFYIMISCPSDVIESEIALKIINEWNSKYTRDFNICFIPLFWQINTTTNINGERPQEILNKSLVYNSDCIVVIFWAKFGSNTGKEASGTLEELKKAYELKKKIGLFFCERPINPSSIIPSDLLAIKNVKDNFGFLGIYQSYSHEYDFQAKFNHFLHEFATDIDKEETEVITATNSNESFKQTSTGAMNGEQEILKLNVKEPILSNPQSKESEILKIDESKTIDFFDQNLKREKDIQTMKLIKKIFPLEGDLFKFLKSMNPDSLDRNIYEQIQELMKLKENSQFFFFEKDLEIYRKSLIINCSRVNNFINLYFKIEHQNLIPTSDLKEKITNETIKVIHDYENGSMQTIRAYNRLRSVFQHIYKIKYDDL